MQPINCSLSVSSVSVIYDTPKGPFQAVHNASFCVERGECLALVGESGCGKTTLAKTISGLIMPTKGIIQLTNGVQIGTPTWHKHIQLIFQDPDSIFNPKRTIGWHLQEVVNLWQEQLSFEKQQERIHTLLEAVELSDDVLCRYSFELSGGQKQRASLIRSLLVDPKYLILDEPLASQDASKRKSVLLLLKQLQKTFNLGYIYITHDLSTLSSIADRVAVMNEGHIVEIESTETLLSHPKHEYTKQLLRARTNTIEKELMNRDL